MSPESPERRPKRKDQAALVRFAADLMLARVAEAESKSPLKEMQRLSRASLMAKVDWLRERSREEEPAIIRAKGKAVQIVFALSDPESGDKAYQGNYENRPQDVPPGHCVIDRVGRLPITGPKDKRDIVWLQPEVPGITSYAVLVDSLEPASAAELRAVARQS